MDQEQMKEHGSMASLSSVLDTGGLEADSLSEV